MSKRKEKNRIKGGFVPITNEMIDSKAFKELNGSALKALILCMRKVKTHDPSDRFTFRFSLTYPEAAKQELGHSTFHRGMRQLQEIGFIDVVSKGGMRFEGKACSYYRLSQRWKCYGNAGFRRQPPGHCIEVNGDD